MREIEQGETEGATVSFRIIIWRTLQAGLTGATML